MQSAYYSKFKALSEPQVPAPDVHTSSSLHQRFTTWYNSLPEISRHRPFAMTEFEQALGTQGKWISPVLLSIGWTRKRRWTGGGQYPRFWMPPAQVSRKHDQTVY